MVLAKLMLELKGSKMPKHGQLKDSVYNFILSYVSSNGFPPSQAEIAENLGHNTRSAVQLALGQLEDENKIVRVKGLFRSIRII